MGWMQLGGVVRLGSGIAPASAPGPAGSTFPADGGACGPGQQAPDQQAPGRVKTSKISTVCGVKQRYGLKTVAVAHTNLVFACVGHGVALSGEWIKCHGIGGMDWLPGSPGGLGGLVHPSKAPCRPELGWLPLRSRILRMLLLVHIHNQPGQRALAQAGRCMAETCRHGGFCSSGGAL